MPRLILARIFSTILALCLLGTVASAQAADTASHRPTIEQIKTQQDGASPFGLLTTPLEAPGLPTGTPYRPILVQIRAEPDGWPLFGLAAADILYETPGIPGARPMSITALYSSAYPETVAGIDPTGIFAFGL